MFTTTATEVVPAVVVSGSEVVVSGSVVDPALDSVLDLLDSALDTAIILLP